MKSILALRRALVAAGLLLTFALAVPSALATHLRGGTISWSVVSTTSTTYTVQFTLTESQRWSYPAAPGSCATNTNASACFPLNSTTTLSGFTGTGSFNFGDGTTGNPTGTVTSINQAQDYATAIFTFTHAYSIAGGPATAFFYASARISTLQVAHDQPEYISTYVQNYPNASPVASEPAILSVPLQNTTTFNLATAVNDIDPNATLVYRLSTFPEMFGPSAVSGLTSVPCPSGIVYTQGGVPVGNPPGFSISTTGLVTWDTTQIVPAITAGNCGFPTPAAGDLWAAQVIVEAHDKTTNAILSTIPIDLLLVFVSPVGALPTVVLNPIGPQTVQIGTPVAFTATGNSTNAGVKVTLNASGVPVGASASGLNATVTPPATSNFTWTPTSSQAGTYVVTYTVTDSNLQQAQASETIIVALLPTISCSAGITVPYGTAGTVSATVYDPNNELLNVVWKVDGATVQTDNGLTAYPNPYTDPLAAQTFGAVGTHSIAATATDPHGVAVSCNTSATVTAAPSVTTLTCPASVTYTGLAQTPCTAMVTGAGGLSQAVPVTYTANVNAGTASASATFAGDANHTGSTKSTTFTIAKATTTTTIAVTTTQTVTGTTATITAKVAPQISGTPTGTVTYMSGTTVLGSAAVGTPFTTGVLPVGADSITATYSGDSNFLTSTSAKATVTSVAPTCVILIVPVPLILYPLPVAYTVIVPLKNFQLITGTITLYDGTKAIATLPLLPGGVDASLTLPGLSAGTHSLTAVYSGDSHYPPGVSPVVTVNVLRLF